MTEPGFEPRSCCCASKYFNQSATKADLEKWVFRATGEASQLTSIG